MNTAADCTCKIGTVSARYDLIGLDEYVGRLHSSGESLRTIRDRINERLVTAVVDADPETVVPDTESVYKVLYAPEEFERDKVTRVRETLRQAGVDVEALTSDFVSHVTARKHLQHCLDTDTQRSSTFTSEDLMNTIEWARTRANSVIDETVRRGQTEEQLQIADPDVTVSVRVTCVACGETFRPRELQEAVACDCANPRP